MIFCKGQKENLTFINRKTRENEFVMREKLNKSMQLGYQKKKSQIGDTLRTPHSRTARDAILRYTKHFPLKNYIHINSLKGG